MLRNSNIVVCAIALAVCIFAASFTIYCQEKVEMWKDYAYTIGELAKSCTDNAPEQNCSWMTYPSHRWNSDLGMWVCDEAHMTENDNILLCKSTDNYICCDDMGCECCE